METDISNIKCEPELEIYDIVEINEDGEPNSEMCLDEDEVDKSCTIEDTSKIKKIHKKPHKCDICGATFRHNYTLNIHKVIHSDEKPYVCDICNQAFRHSYTLKTHKNNIHIKEKSYVCDICDRAFSLANTLRDHRYLHSEERSFKCDVCDKKFKNPAAVRHHKRIHSGKKFNCDLCDASYTRPSNLKSHKLVHSGEYPFQCSICKKKFRERRYYKDHKCGKQEIKIEDGSDKEEGVVDVCN